VLSFSERAQEPWVSEIPARVIRASYLVVHEGTITWGQYRLCQTGKSCLGMWPWTSGTAVEFIFQERPLPPQPSYGGTLRLTFSLSLSVLLRRVSPSGNWGKAPSPLQLYGRQSEETWTPDRGLYHTANAVWVEPDFSAPRLFSFFLSLNSNFLSRSDPLKRRSENGRWEGKFVFKPQKVFWPGHSPVSPKG
jgi:hypothetical protein